MLFVVALFAVVCSSLVFCLSFVCWLRVLLDVWGSLVGCVLFVGVLFAIDSLSIVGRLVVLCWLSCVGL